MSIFRGRCRTRLTSTGRRIQHSAAKKRDTSARRGANAVMRRIEPATGHSGEDMGRLVPSGGRVRSRRTCIFTWARG
jgi:hypothetical protein